MAKIPSRGFSKAKKKIPSRAFAKSKTKIPSRPFAKSNAKIASRPFGNGTAKIASRKPSPAGAAKIKSDPPIRLDRPTDVEARQDRVAALVGQVKALLPASNIPSRN